MRHHCSLRSLEHLGRRLAPDERAGVAAYAVTGSAPAVAPGRLRSRATMQGMPRKLWIRVSALAFLVGALTAVLLVLVAQGSPSPAALHLVIEAMAAVGTVGALVAAIWSIQRQAARDQATELDRRLAAERAQAEHVSAWCLGTGDPNADGLDVHVMCRNGSTAPVYSLGITAYPIEQWQHAQTWVTRDDLGALGPGKEARLVVRFSPPVTFNLGTHTPVAVRFVDAAGRHWLRQPDGTLIRRE